MNNILCALRKLFVCGLVFVSAGICCGTAFSAQGTKFSINGDMDFSFNLVDRPLYGTKDSSEDLFVANQRLRLFLTARTSDELRLFAVIRIRPHHWGAYRNREGYALDSDGVNLRTRQLYLDWAKPDGPWQVRVGIIPAVAPGAAFFNSILFTTAGGLQVSYRLNDTVALKGAYYRPYDDQELNVNPRNGEAKTLHDDMDMVYFSIPITHEAAQVEPWGIYTRIGKDSGFFQDRTPVVRPMMARTGAQTIKDNGHGWWGGVAAEVNKFDPLVVKLDFAYGKLTTGSSYPNFNAQGWFADMAVDYKLECGIPGLFGWYATGSNAEDVRKNNLWGYIPTISSFDEGFNPTSFGFRASDGVIKGATISGRAAGHWGFGAQMKAISFVDDLDHLIRIAYYQGTNDKKLGRDPVVHRSAVFDRTFLTKQDSVYEINLNHHYRIYENLDLWLDTGYLDVDRGSSWRGNKTRSAWQVASNIKFRF